MAKTLHEVTMSGRYYNSSNELVVAKTSDASEVVCFIGPSADGMDNEYFHAEVVGNTLLLTTPKGEYKLVKHPTQNYWLCTANSVKVQITLKKIVAYLRFWA